VRTGFIKRKKDGYIYFASPVLDGTGLVSHGFSTRHKGVSKGFFESLNLGFGRGDDEANVRRNFDIACGALGMDSRTLTFSKQVHSSTVRVITKSERSLENINSVPEADAMITNVSNLPLAVFYADCVPVFLLDPVKMAVAAVHSGWRGTVRGIVRQAVLSMNENFQSLPEDILAAIGPCVGPCCYKVGDDVCSSFHTEYGDDIARFFSTGAEGDTYLDLKAANGFLLERAGLKPENIQVAENCTCCEWETFYSHRRDGQLRGNQAAFIMLNPKGVRTNA
jgi:YfiH family protein